MQLWLRASRTPSLPPLRARDCYGTKQGNDDKVARSMGSAHKDVAGEEPTRHPRKEAVTNASDVRYATTAQGATRGAVRRKFCEPILLGSDAKQTS
jgi:hypothetical protein